MNRMKKLVVMLAAVLVLAMGLQSVALAATSSPAKTDINSGKGSVTSVDYTAKAQKAQIKLVVGGKTLVEGKDFKVVSKDRYVGAGKHYVTIEGIGAYEGTMTVVMTIKPVAASLTVTQPVKTISYKKVISKASAIVDLTSTTPVPAKVTYTVAKAPTKAAEKYIVVNSKGQVKIKKNAPTGTYKVKVVSTPTSPNFTGTSKIISIVVK